MKEKLKVFLHRGNFWGKEQTEGIRSLLQVSQSVGECRKHKRLEMELRPVHCIVLVGFHHKQGGIIEFKYPPEAEVTDEVINLALPEGIHNVPSEKHYFVVSIQDRQKFCVASFKQVPNAQASGFRNYIQKSVTVISNVPFLGAIGSTIQSATQEYFDQNDFDNTAVLQRFYENLTVNLVTCSYSDLYLDLSVSDIVHRFKHNVLVVWKMILLEMRVLVYSSLSSDVSRFIFSLLSLFPGQLMFNSAHRAFAGPSKALEIYGLPLCIFNEEHPVLPFVSLGEINYLEKSGYLIGCTNRLIIERPPSPANAIINLDNSTIYLSPETKNLKELRLRSEDLEFAAILQKSTQTDDFIRGEFAKYLMELLSDIALFRHNGSLNNLHQEFVCRWASTKNFQEWSKRHSDKLHWLSLHADHSPAFKVEYENGDVYNGSFYRGLKHGRGVYEYAGGGKYDGTWENNQRHGAGTFTNESYIYDGEWIHDRKTGDGKEITEFTKYSGGFKHGRYHRYGTLIDKDGSVYEGDFYNGKKKGHGILTRKDRTVYKGNFKADAFHGTGELKHSNGDFYHGSFRYGLRNGMGEIKFVNGGSYRGEFANDMYHGRGIFTLSSGVTATGVFVNGNVITKHCFLKFIDGREYEGEITEDFKPVL